MKTMGHRDVRAAMQLNIPNLKWFAPLSIRDEKRRYK